MPHDHNLSFTTTASGVVGGVTKAVSEQMTLSSISFQGITDVAFYAVISASVGYCVKVAWDVIFQKFRSRKTSNQ